MKQRVTSALLFGGAALLSLFIQIFFGYALVVMGTVIAVLCIYELYRCVEIPVRGIFFLYAETYALLTILSFAITRNDAANFVFWFRVYLTLAFFLVTTINGFFSRDGLRKTIRLGAITVLIVISVSVLVYWAGLCTYAGEGAYSILPLFMLLVTLLAPFSSDIAGLLVGSALGKHKMAPTISPKKTWEGFVGSCVGSAAVMLILGGLCHLICHALSLPYQVNYISLLLSGLIGAVVGTMGDLFFSIIKRKTGIKDYGSIIPGHGGMLDRFDSVIFAAPILFLLYQIYPQVISLVG